MLSLIDRKHTLFPNDLDKHEDELGKIIPDSSFLVMVAQVPLDKPSLKKSLSVTLKSCML